MIDLENGDIVYIEPVGAAVRLTVVKLPWPSVSVSMRLTAEEARTMAHALMAAADETEARGPQ